MAPGVLSAGRHALVFVAYLGLAIGFTWPLTPQLSTGVADLGDPLLNVWILDWDCYALTHAPLRIFQAPVFYPSKYPLAYSENLIAVAAAVLPFHLAGLSPIAVYNLAVLIGLALSAFGGYVLARVVTGNLAASFIAGILYGFVPYKLAHFAHIQILWSLWPPLLLAALLTYRRSPNLRNAALIAAVIVLGAMTNMYYFLFANAALGLTLLLIAIAERHDTRFWLGLFGAAAVAGLLLIPILRPYQVVSKEYRMRRGWGETLGGSATPSDWLIAPHPSIVYGRIVDPEKRQNERQLFPGLMVLLLAAAGLLLTPPRKDAPDPPVRRRPPRWLDALIVFLAILTWVGAVIGETHITLPGHFVLEFGTTKLPATLLVVAIIIRLAIRFPRSLGDGNLRSALQRSRFPLELWAAALWIAIGVLGSLGLTTFFHSFLFDTVPGFRAVRVPARWAMIAYAGLAPWAAYGAVAVAGNRRWRTALLLALALIDIWPRTRWEQAPVEVSPVDRWIAEAHAGPLFFLPIHRLNLLFEYMLRATLHHQPIMNAISGFEPPLHRGLRERPLDKTTLDKLERNGYRFVVVRPDWSGGSVVSVYPWLRENLANGRLAFVRRFEYHLNGDWVFAITRVEKDWRRFRVPAVRDGAGFTADEELERLLRWQQVYSGITFGQLNEPKPGTTITGAMEVSGSAISPEGIRSVTVLIDRGRHRVAATLRERAEISKGLPWYPRTPRPAFAVTIPARPPDVPEETDVQIEIVDGRGHVTLLRDVLFTWK